ncbi:MAG: AI-2E family transporter [Leptolyngbyaceae cyanobacterium bins.59]|nr:AI-2E family transporter [Leptolyngbyaceae cyanobacterium bins.59]
MNRPPESPLPSPEPVTTPSRTLWDQLSNSSLVRFLLFFATGWALVQLLDYFEPVIVIFTFATIVAFLLSYPVSWLDRYLHHTLAVMVVFFIGGAIIVGLATTVGLTILSQSQQLFDRLTEIINSFATLLEGLEIYLRSRNIQVNLTILEEQLRNLALAGVGFSIGLLQSLLTNLITLILITVVALFMLLDGSRLWNLALKLVPRSVRPRFAQSIQQNFLGFFRGQLLLALFLTLMTFLIFLALEVPLALLLSVIIGLFDMIPGIGATLGVGLVVLFVLSQNGWLALKVLVLCVLLQQLQDNLIAPRIMQNSLNLNPVVVFFALLVGARIAGLLGVFLSVPLAGVLVSLLEIDEMKSEQ